MIEFLILVIVVGGIAKVFRFFPQSDLVNLAILRPDYLHSWWLLIPLLIILLPGLYAFTMSPYIPIARQRIPLMLKWAALKPTDIVYDLGSGDGRLVFAAARHAKRAMGYELSILLLAGCYLRKFLTFSKAHFRFGNFFKKDISNANVIFCYLPGALLERFKKEMMPTLAPGTRIVISSREGGLIGIKPAIKEDNIYLYIK